MAIFPLGFTIEPWSTLTKVTMNNSLVDFDAVMRFDPNSLALYARGLTLLKKGDTVAGTADITATKAINPNIEEQFDHSESAVR